MNLSNSALNAKDDELGQFPSLVYMIFVIGMQNKSKENDGLRNVTRSGVQHYAYLGRWGPTLDSYICARLLHLHQIPQSADACERTRRHGTGSHRKSESSSFVK